jgi:hypothetical protein
MTQQSRPVTINMSGISVSGVGGLGLVAMAALTTWVLPQAWWLVAFGAIGGILVGVGVAAYRRYHATSGPSGDDPRVLFRAEEPTPNRERSHPVPRADVAELATL